MTARKAITRSKQTFRVKFPSLKNNCMIHCESILEADTARYLEISPLVERYEAQPGLEIYYDTDGKPRRYYPDFRAYLTDGLEVDIEAKPEEKLNDPVIKAKLEGVSRRYAELGRLFRIFTDRHVRCEPLYSNLQLVQRHSRTPIHHAKLKELKGQANRANFRTVVEAAAVLGGEQHVHRLISVGHLGVDFNQHISPDSLVWVRGTGGENDSLRV